MAAAVYDEWNTNNIMTRTIARQLGVMALAVVVLATLSLRADSSKVNDITASLVKAGASVQDLKALEVGGIVVLRGRTDDRAAAEQVAILAHGLGYARVANLIQVLIPADDAAIERLAERQLGMSRSLDGCQIHVDSDNGVVRLNGTVQSELQKDVAIQLVRSIYGVKSVQFGLRK
jgi:osmotically-inducible protein OsmY